MNKLQKILTIMLAVIYLAGCSANSSDMPYEIVADDDGYRLILDDTLMSLTDNNASDITVVPSITFDSIEEMKHDIETGNFTEHELEQLSQFEKDEAGQIKICNLDNLYTAQFPTTHGSYRVSWGCDGEDYGFYLPYKGINMHIRSKEEFDEELDEHINFEKNTTFQIQTKSVEPDRKATVYTCVDHQRQIKRAFYTISCGSKTLYVDEFYNFDISDTIPHIVSAIGSDNGMYFEVICVGLQERPSVEWLSEFGLVPYVDSSAS